MNQERITNQEYNFSIILHVNHEGFCCCPVCGVLSKNKTWRPYDSNGVPSYDICVCNFQFGVDDGDFPGPYTMAWESYREKWLQGTLGIPQKLALSQKKEQLKNIGVNLDL